ncbi:UNVERIFIED_CONTAM: hypothetical protein Scaly_1662000 [Sesamum calycinum]|uniref:Uncharacterized protein n=1 Tax=Sesamum calycinum TaxID=2727403 RepID=A0AAW2NSF4_9LAMI
MTSEYMLMTMVIPGPFNPERLIDVHLKFEELQNFWHVGVLMPDNVNNEKFMMRVALMWTVNNLPAYRMAYGWSTAGVMGCPILQAYWASAHFQEESVKNKANRTANPAASSTVYRGGSCMHKRKMEGDLGQLPKQIEPFTRCYQKNADGGWRGPRVAKVAEVECNDSSR